MDRESANSELGIIGFQDETDDTVLPEGEAG